MRIVDAASIDDPRADQTTQLEKVMPIAAVTGEPRCVEAEHRADLPGAHCGDESVEARAGHAAAGGAAQIIIDDLDAGKSMPSGDLDQVILATLALEVRLHLGLRGLTHIHDSLAAEERFRQCLNAHRRTPGAPRPLPVSRLGITASRP